MPHNFIRISVETPNPGKRRRADVKKACDDAGGTFEYLWFDDEDQPTAAYVLVKDGKIDDIMRALHGEQVIRLFQAPN